MKLKYFIVTIFIILFAFTHKASAASMYVISGAQTVYEGDTVLVDWYLDTGNESFNVINAKVGYSTSSLELSNISTGSSAISLWVESPEITSPGVISLVGGVPGGISGGKVPVMRTVFKASKQGDAVITIDPSSVVLRADGSATSVPFSMHPLAFSVLPAKSKSDIISSPTNKDQNKWYQNRNVVINLNIVKDGNYLYSFGANEDIIPSIPAKDKSFVFDGLDDGVYYFKVGLLSEKGLQEVATYRVMIDSTAPSFLSEEIDKGQTVFNGKTFVNFYASDKTSGIKSYKVKVGWLDWYHDATNPYQISRPIFGTSVKIKAYDQANNKEVVEIPFKGYLSFWPGVIILAVIVSIFLYYLYLFICQKFFLKKS